MARLENDYTGDGSDLEYTKKKVIAPGKYKAIISQCDYKQNKQGNGFNLIPTFKIVEGEYTGEELTQWLCVKHPTADTQAIAIRKKARIGVILCGTPNPADTNLLLNKPLLIETDTLPDSFVGKDGATIDTIKNVIVNYHPITGDFKSLNSGKKTTAPVRSDIEEVDIGDSIPF